MELPKHQVLLSKEEIEGAVQRLGKQITTDYRGRDLVVVGILNGSFIFLADLVRAIDLPLHVEFMQVASYVGAESTGSIQLIHDIRSGIENRDVIVVEDIIDTGLTLDYLLKRIGSRNPASLKICSLLTKPEAHQKAYQVDYVGFEIANQFVVGYGLDFDQRFRNLRDIIVIES